VHDALLDVAEGVQADAELDGIVAQRLNLDAAGRVGDRLVDVEGGVLWSSVASVRSGRRTGRPAIRSPSNACGLVTS